MKHKNTCLIASVGFILMAGCLANAAGQSQDLSSPDFKSTVGFSAAIFFSIIAIGGAHIFQSNGAAALNSGTPVEGSEMVGQPIVEDVYASQNFRCTIASQNDYINIPGEKENESQTVSEISLHLIRNDSTGEDIAYSIGAGSKSEESTLEFFDIKEAMESYRSTLYSDFRKYEIEYQNAMDDATLPMPVMAAKPMQPSYSARYQGGSSKGHPNTALEYSVNGRTMAKLKCNSTLHDVHVNTTSGGEGKAYGQGGSRKQAYAINRVHQERWCDSADVEGSLYMESLSRSIKVRCAYRGETRMK